MAQVPIQTPAGSQAQVDAHSAAAGAHAGSASTGDVTTAVSAHEAAGDPHPVYLTQIEGDTRYAGADLSDYATDAELAAGLSGRQPLDSDLTALAGLTPANDDLPQRKAGAWTGRTPAQVKADMALSYADLSGTVPQAAIPAIAITEYLGAVATQAAMLALVGQRGDWCTRTDLGTDWQLIADNPAALVSWREMTYPASPVQSVNDRTGAVTGLAEQTSLTTHTGDTANPHAVTKAQVGLGSADNVSAAALRARTSHTGEQEISTVTGLQVAIDGKARKLTPTAAKTTTYTAVDGDLVNCNATGGAFTVTLPAAAANMVIAIRKGDTSVNAITVARAGTDTIGVVDPITSLTLDLPHQVVTLIGVAGGWIPASGIARRTLPDVQAFTVSGTWVKPAGCTFVTARMLAGGQGGGSGARRASGSASSGAAGGSGAAASLVTLAASALGATESVTVGAGGLGGVAVTTNDTDGNAGGLGGTSRFGSTVGGIRVAANPAFTAPGGGRLGASSTGGSTASGDISGAAGGVCASGAAGGGGNRGTSSGAGGGAGGGISATPAAFAGGTGGSPLHLGDASAAAGSAGGGNGVAGTNAPSQASVSGGGGSGGGGSTTGAGGAGGDGGLYGAGGGGGASSPNGSNSGPGGAGSQGIVVVISE